MTTSPKAEAVQGGYYWSPRTLEVRLIPGGGGALPETGGGWVRIPGWLLVSMAPVVGGLFVVGLPVVGLSLLARDAVRRAAARAGDAAANLAARVAPGFTPGEAHLGGRPGERPAPPSPELDEVEEQIRARQRLEEHDEAAARTGS
jgi:hypothetical protein